VYGGERMQNMLKRLFSFFRIDDDTPIRSKMLTRQIEGAQKRIEGRNFGIRKRVLQYDDVMNSQRSEVYGDRQKVLRGEDVHRKILDMLPGVADSVLSFAVDVNKPYVEWDLEAANKILKEKLLQTDADFLTRKMAESLNYDEILSRLCRRATEEYEQKIAAYKDQQGIDYGEVERFILLKVVDEKWTEHIDAMDQFRKSVGLKGYAQQDPIVYYKQEGYDMYYEMTEHITNDTVLLLLKLKVEKTEPMRRAAPSSTRAGFSDNEKQLQPGAAKQPALNRGSAAPPQISRNANCPCGSRKKYKHCCGK
jgi:preprotein translocase subunit SecA